MSARVAELHLTTIHDGRSQLVVKLDDPAGATLVFYGRVRVEDYHLRKAGTALGLVLEPYGNGDWCHLRVAQPKLRGPRFGADLPW